MANFDLAFQPENGINLDGLVGIFTGTIDPSVVGEVAPIGSLYLSTSGRLYQKVTTLNTGWMVFSQGLGEAIKISATDTTSGYLNTKLLTSASITKTLGNTGANETLTLDLANIGTAGTYTQVTTNAKGQVTAGANPTTLAGYGITNGQPLDATLTALAAYATVGFVAMTSTDVFAGRTITGTANQITVTNGAGTAGNPTLSFPATTLTFPGTAGVILPRGTTAQRVATTAYTRFNNDTTSLEYYNGTTWVSLVASTGGTVTSISTSAPAAGLTITGGPITTTGTLTFTLANDLAALEGIVTTGFSARIGTDTWATRTLTGPLDRITITNGAGIAGDPIVDIAATYVGQTSITTLGNIVTGSWAATTIDVNHGGTGRTSIGGANTVLGVNTTATALEYKVITGGTGINVSATANQLQIVNSGVTSVTGTTNQVNVSGSTGSITFSLPQSIATTSSPTFAQVTVGTDPITPLQLATKQYVDNAVQGLDAKQSVAAATTVDITLSGEQTIDNVALVAGDRVLVKNQTTASQNGIYIVSTGAWTRALDLDTWAEAVDAFTFVESGIALAGTGWIAATARTGTIDTTAMPWVQFSQAGVVNTGGGLTQSGTTISLVPVGTAGSYNNVTTNAYGQVTSGSTVAYLTANQNITLQGDITGVGNTLITTTLSNTGVAAGAYQSVTVDAKGRITAGTNPTTLAGYNITDAQALNAYLTSLSALATNGIVVRSGNTALVRSIIAGSTKVSVNFGDGVSGNPTVDVVEANLALNNISGTLAVNKGGTGLVAAGSANSILGVNAAGTALEYKTITGTGITVAHSTNGISLTAVNNGTVTSVAASGSTGLTVGGSPITSSGTLTFTLGAELQALSGLATLGLVTRTAAGTYTQRSITTAGSTLNITNAAGTAGNINLDLATIGTAGTYRSVTTDVYGRVTSGTNPTTLAGYGITDAVSTSLLGAANGVATLDASGLLLVSQLPATAITDTFVVASQAAQTALTAQVGDVAVRTDLNKSYILRALPATVFANWQELLTPTDAVLSVNGQTGAVSVGTVTSIGITPPGAGITVAGSPITTAGSIALSLADDLNAVESLATTGLAVRTGTSTWATRSLVAGSGISLTNADGVAGNITIAATVTGAVTSVGLALPSIFSVTGTPVTTTGTLTGTLAAQTAKTVFAGPTTGSAATPTFRTLALGSDLSDVVVTTPTVGQVLAYDNTTSKWVNAGAVGTSAAGLIGVGQAGAAAWTLSSGTRYVADFAHGLGTTNVVITVYDTATNAVIVPDSIVLTNTTTVRVTVIGNTRTLRVVVVANGNSVSIGGGGGGGNVAIAKDGATVVTTASTINFRGSPVTVADAGSGTANVTLGARYSFMAHSLDTPNTADYAVNAIAATTTDPTSTSLSVRSFSNTVEQGVAFQVSIPANATTMTVKIRGRAATAPGAVNVVQPRLYSRIIPNNAAMGAWSSAFELNNITIPTNAFFQYFTQTIPLTSLSITADNLYQFELTRRITGVTGTNLAAAFYLVELICEFS